MLPVYSLVNILLKSDLDVHKICHVQPLGVTENSSFVVDIDSVDFQDLKAGDLQQVPKSVSTASHHLALFELLTRNLQIPITAIIPLPGVIMYTNLTTSSVASWWILKVCCH